YYWLKMTDDINTYCLGCRQCRKIKPDTHQTFGRLQPRPTPERAWSRVGLELITDLPTSRQGHDAIQVHVCHFGKGIRLAPTKKASGVIDPCDKAVCDSGSG
ncbi:hypothetical protein V1524DRAFT_371752, partial [Lipomyces starkeyi]